MQDQHMISDEALNARYSDQEVIKYLEADEDMSESYHRIRNNKPEKLSAFLLAFKRTMYRDTGEYSQAVLNDRMKRKPRPSYRPMAGHGGGFLSKPR